MSHLESRTVPAVINAPDATEIAIMTTTARVALSAGKEVETVLLRMTVKAQ